MQTTKTGKIKGKLPLNLAFSKKLERIGKQGAPKERIEKLRGA